MGRKEKNGPPVVGISSLLVIFSVLCLTVFALLSISTVQADGRLSEKSAAAVECYYEAEAAAQEILARIRSGQLPEGVSTDDGTYTYACKISDTQTLAVQVAVEGDDYEILRWQAVSTADWEANTDIPVWNGETQ